MSKSITLVINTTYDTQVAITYPSQSDIWLEIIEIIHNAAGIPRDALKQANVTYNLTDTDVLKSFMKAYFEFYNKDPFDFNYDPDTEEDPILIEALRRARPITRR